MNKWGYILVLLIAVIVIAASFIGFKIFFTPATPAPSQPTSYTTVPQPSTTTVVPAQPTNTTPTGDTLSLASAFGGTIIVKDFKNDPVVVKDPVNPGYYYFGYHIYEGVPDPTASTTTPPYIIQYIDKTQYFNISILQAPIGATRTTMEQYLMAHLGISQNQMCQLKYTVGVASSIAPQDINANIGFSFCPGATVFAH